ncbi:hypothetical protein OROMI_006132 [Orobanche minor]
MEKTAFIFCVEDRALLCKDYDDPIHSANTRAANHQRFLATGVRVALGSSCNKEIVGNNMDPLPPKSNSQQIGPRSTSQHVCGITSPSWAVDELLQLSDYESTDKFRLMNGFSSILGYKFPALLQIKEQLEFNELEWLTNINLFGGQVSEEALAAAEVPQLPLSQHHNMNAYRAPKFYTAYKKHRSNHVMKMMKSYSRFLILADSRVITLIMYKPACTKNTKSYTHD